MSESWQAAPELSAKQIETGWRDAFSTKNPFCPCDLKSFTKAVRWAERAIMAASAVPEEPLRAAVKAVVAMLNNREYAEHWAHYKAPGDADAGALEGVITDLVSDAHEEAEPQSAPLSESAIDEVFQKHAPVWHDRNPEVCRHIAADILSAGAAPVVSDKRNVGDSKFEGWHSDYADKRETNPKQIARDAYAAGMGDNTPQPAEQNLAARDALYVAIGYGESDLPDSRFVHSRDELLDAVLSLIYTRPSDADTEEREAYRKDLEDEDEWSGGIWRTEFEIGGIVIYQLAEIERLDNQAASER